MLATSKIETLRDPRDQGLDGVIFSSLRVLLCYLRRSIVWAMHLLVFWIWCARISSLRWIGVRQTATSQVMEGRQEARVATPPEQSPNSIRG